MPVGDEGVGREGEMTGNCGDCRYSIVRSDGVLICRRYPPQVVPELVRDYDASVSGTITVVGVQTAWPVVDETESCGEHQHK